MEYEIAELSERLVAGVSDVTGNDAPDMGAKIGGLWRRFSADGAQRIAGRTNAKVIGLYTDYRADGSYTVLAGAEISPDARAAAQAAGLSVHTVPAGRYAKFTVRGDIVRDVGAAWGGIRQTPLARRFTCDFEEYQEDCARGNGTIFIYIAIE